MANYEVRGERFTPVQALLRDVPDVRKLLPEFLRFIIECFGVADEDFRADDSIANEFTGWMPIDVQHVYAALRRDLSQSTNACRSSDEFKWLVKDMSKRITDRSGDAPAWSPLFLKRQLLNYVSGNRYGMELWRTSVLTMWPWTPPTDVLVQFCALTSCVEDHGQGWHLHPMGPKGREGYRLLFDPDRSENELFWEYHKERNRPCTLGNPAEDTLSRSNAKKLYPSCLEVCYGANRLTGNKNNKLQYRQWAINFAPASPTATYLALWKDTSTNRVEVPFEKTRWVKSK